MNYCLSRLVCLNLRATVSRDSHLIRMLMFEGAVSKSVYGGVIVNKLFFAAIVMLSLIGCATAGDHRAAVQDPVDGELTVGTVQKEIRVGMAGGEVAATLGSPNIVSTDEQRREVWIYDKVSTDYAYSNSSGGVGALILGWGGSAGGLGNAGYSSGAGAASRTQKTLTIIIKFDEEGLVRDFAYHTSKF
jgi:outer membrane protein assembly factor BamE (lipoprotein component of BamABCDE complex)